MDSKDEGCNIYTNIQTHSSPPVSERCDDQPTRVPQVFVAVVELRVGLPDHTLFFVFIPVQPQLG